MGRISEEFYSATKFVLIFYISIFISVFLLVAAAVMFLAYKERKDTQEILVYLDKNYPVNSEIEVKRGYYTDCSGILVGKKEFVATVDLNNCKGTEMTRTNLHFRDLDDKAYKFWIKYPFFLSDFLLG